MDVIYLPLSESFTSEDRALMSFVSRRRAERIGKFHRGSDRKTSLYATLLVIMYLRSHCDIPADGPRFERTPDGKPYAPGLSVRFSCSHTDGAVLAAFSELDETGCDVELIADPPCQISSIAFSQNERDALDQCIAAEEELTADGCPAPGREFPTDKNPRAGGLSIHRLLPVTAEECLMSSGGTAHGEDPSPGISIDPEERRALTFYTIWTRKEAYLKYLGTGLSGDITKTDVCDPAISRRFISKRIGSHMCSVFNGTYEPVDFTTMDESAVRSFFLG